MHRANQRRKRWAPFCRLFVISLVICLSGVMSRGAMAQNPEVAVKKRDKDGDGRVSRDEWKESGEVFAKIDANQDNHLTTDEFSAHFKALKRSKLRKKKKKNAKKKGTASKSKKPKTILKNMDKDGDTKVARQEWRGQKALFGKIDANQDDHLTLKELNAHFGSPAGSDGKKKKGGKAKAQKSKTKTPQTLVKNMDTDGDGKIAREEWKGQEDQFDKIDADRDTRLTVEELGAHLSTLAGSEAGKKGSGKPKGPNTVIKNMDEDGDGTIARDEWKGPAEAYDQIDADGDNRVTAKELAAIIGAREQSKGGKGKKADVKNPATAVTNMDKNRDSVVARDEWTGPGKQFEMMDANRDNKLTPEELAASFVKKLDKDGNGKLSRGETKFSKERFDKLDKDGDDHISAKEYSADLGWGGVSR